jgi:carbon-monoxide dehydrogenase large subunit
MNIQTPVEPTSAERAEKLQGMGCKRKRVEDIRFTQGKGSYVDDLKLPGMLFGDFVRSSHAHAQIKARYLESQGATGWLAVLTAADLKPLNLHYMPTLAGDVQAVLADEKVLFSESGNRFCRCKDRYIAAMRSNWWKSVRTAAGSGRSISRRWIRTRRCCVKTSRTR